MAGCCDCIGSCEHWFEGQILTLDGLLYAIKHDQDHLFTIHRSPERARPFTNPPQARRWAILGTTKRRFGSGHISTWDLRDEQGDNIGLCYTERGQLGITLEMEEKSKVTTYDPPDSCDRVVTIVHIIPTSELDMTMRNAAYAALRDLITITPA